tara:strand:+ start:4309 stop:4659 length:351 start_codon:yes stop_codon:yes gene_type:complete
MPPKVPGSVLIDGCRPSAGYVFCEILNKCIRTWIQACEYPQNCLTWFDGCNSCMLVEGENGLTLGGCTEMMCFQQGTPQCSVWAPGTISTMPVIDYPMPVIDPLPPVINPFTGGHR